MAEIEYQSKDKERLDKFLATLFDSSREKIQKLIDKNKINVNNRPVKKNYFLKSGDKIETFEDEAEKNELDKITYFPLKLDIIKETPNYLVLNKPAGLVIHPLRSFKEKTLATALLNFYPEIKGVGDPSTIRQAHGGEYNRTTSSGQINLRPGIVHRLDKDVSGLILVAKTQKSFDYFKEEFRKHRVQKEYLALVYGQPAKRIGVISLALTKQGAKTIIAKNADLDEIKDSWTEYEVLEKFKDFSLLKVKIKTGRTHQIRIHLKSINCPIVGDKKYKIKRQKIINLGRVFLHSYKLGFYDQSGEWQEYQSDLPIELKSFVQNLESLR